VLLDICGTLESDLAGKSDGVPWQNWAKARVFDSETLAPLPAHKSKFASFVRVFAELGLLGSGNRNLPLRLGQAGESWYHEIMQPAVKRVGQSGQISVGRELAGKLLRFEQLEDGRLLLTPVVDVPESQMWTLSEPNKSRIERGLTWASKTPAKETDLSALVTKANRRKTR